jgi:putative endonuclease
MIGCYILHTKAYNKFYIGATQEDPISRLDKHNNKFYGGTSTSYTDDWELFLFIQCSSFPQAVNIEKHIKNMKSKTYFFNLAKYPEMIEKLLQKYP